MNLYLSGFLFFFFNDTATTEIYTLSLHDALPISGSNRRPLPCHGSALPAAPQAHMRRDAIPLLSPLRRDSSNLRFHKDCAATGHTARSGAVSTPGRGADRDPQQQVFSRWWAETWIPSDRSLRSEEHTS